MKKVCLTQCLRSSRWLWLLFMVLVFPPTEGLPHEGHYSASDSLAKDARVIVANTAKLSVELRYNPFFVKRRSELVFTVTDRNGTRQQDVTMQGSIFKSDDPETSRTLVFRSEDHVPGILVSRPILPDLALHSVALRVTVRGRTEAVQLDGISAIENAGHLQDQNRQDTSP